MQTKAYITLQDQRKLFWYESGLDNGVPIIFCTGAGMSGSLNFADEIAEKLKVKIYSFDRPGLGDSDPHPQKSFATWISDIKEFIANKNLKEIRAVGFSQGSPFALSLAHAGLTESTAIVSGQDDFHYPDIHTKLPEEVRGMIGLVSSAPDMIKEEFAKIASPDFIWNIVMQSASPVDLAYYSLEGFSRKYKQSLNEGFSKGPAGYIQDFINCASPWPFQVEEIKTPVHLWYGKQDTSPVHSPDFGETLSKRIPHSKLHQERKEGGSLLWRMSEDILKSLL